MAHVTGTILIAAPVERVFDTVADSRLEPSFNPAMTEVELLTGEPIGRGTRFRARMGNARLEMVVELTEFDRPHRLGSRTTSSMMETTGTLTCTGEAGSTRLSWDWQVHPKGLVPGAGPTSATTWARTGVSLLFAVVISTAAGVACLRAVRSAASRSTSA